MDSHSTSTTSHTPLHEDQSSSPGPASPTREAVGRKSSLSGNSPKGVTRKLSLTVPAFSNKSFAPPEAVTQEPLPTDFCVSEVLVVPPKLSPSVERLHGN